MAERQNPRAPATLEVKLKSASVGDFVERKTRDISTGGMFVEALEPMEVGTLLRVELQFEDEPLVQGVGRVVWNRKEGQGADELPAGMGVKFVKIDEASRGVIGKFVDTLGVSDEGSSPEARGSSYPARKSAASLSSRPPAMTPPVESKNAPVETKAEAATSAADVVEETASDAADAASDAAGDVADAASDAAGDVADAASDAADAAGDVADSVADAGKDAVEASSDVVDNVAEAAKDAVDASSDVADAVSTSGSALKEAGSDVAEKAADVVDAAKDSSLSALSGLVGASGKGEDDAASKPAEENKPAAKAKPKRKPAKKRNKKGKSKKERRQEAKQKTQSRKSETKADTKPDSGAKPVSAKSGASDSKPTAKPVKAKNELPKVEAQGQGGFSKPLLIVLVLLALAVGAYVLSIAEF